MKKIIVFLWVFLSNLNLFAQIPIDSDIKNVKIYKNNAEITRKINTKMESGNQTIVLTGISTYINPASLQVKLASQEKVTLLSAKYERNFILPAKINPEHQKLKDKIDLLTEELSWIKEQNSIYVGMEDVMNKNKDLGGNDAGFTPNQVAELADVYKTKLFEIRKKLFSLRKETKAKNKEKNALQNQLNEMNAKFNKPSGNIVLQVAVDKPTSASFKCTYIVSNAGWTPLYDLRSEGIDKNVNLNYKANVFQNTGQDWKNAKIIISTGNPALDNNRPILRPLYANYFVAHYNRGREYDEGINKKMIQSATNMAYESVEDTELNYDEAYKYNAQISENQLSIEFEINHKQDILSDGKQNMIPLESYELKTKYTYHVVPKLNRSAFLLAKISGWSKYNLIPGTASIFFDGAYVGESYINSQVTADELLLSMGRDESISVERKSLKEYTERKFLGPNKKETYAYEIAIKNKKSIAIDIEILDQIPVSQNKEIMVELEEKGEAKYTKEFGKLLWEYKIQAGQTQKMNFIYHVKYPKDKKVSGLK